MPISRSLPSHTAWQLTGPALSCALLPSLPCSTTTACGVLMLASQLHTTPTAQPTASLRHGPCCAGRPPEPFTRTLPLPPCCWERWQRSARRQLAPALPLGQPAAGLWAPLKTHLGPAWPALQFPSLTTCLIPNCALSFLPSTPPGPLLSPAPNTRPPTSALFFRCVRCHAVCACVFQLPKPRHWARSPFHARMAPSPHATQPHFVSLPFCRTVTCPFC